VRPYLEKPFTKIHWVSGSRCPSTAKKKKRERERGTKKERKENVKTGPVWREGGAGLLNRFGE
jgi:hypothetical protein